MLIFKPVLLCRADSRFAPSQWETPLLCNDVSHWLGTSLKSAVIMVWCYPSICPSVWSVKSPHSQYEHMSDFIGPFYKHRLTLIPPWISDYTHYNGWMKFPIQSQNSPFQSLKIGKWISNLHHYMEMLSALLAICAGKPQVTSRFPAQRVNDVALWRFLLCQPEQTAEQTI